MFDRKHRIVAKRLSNVAFLCAHGDSNPESFDRSKDI
jgi:hypothetical protein